VPGGQRDDQIAMKLRQRAAGHNHATIRRTREVRDSTLDLAGVAYVDRAYLHSDRRGHRLDRAELASPSGGGITEDRSACHARCNLLEQFQPFPAQAIFELNETGCIAARSRQAINEPPADRVGDYHKHDGHGARRL
jgi:hypothetical protein